MRTWPLAVLGLVFLMTLPCPASAALRGDRDGAVPAARFQRDFPPTVYRLALLIMGVADIGGNLCVTGPVHLNPPNEPDDASHVTCEASVTTGFTITPPAIFTDPERFPGATYYYVKGNKIGATWQAKILDRNGVDITGLNTMTDVLTYNATTKTFIYNFNTAAKLTKYFDEATGVFRRDVGDSSVVVNFGEEAIVDPPGALGVSMLSFDGDAGSTIRATVINTRYVGPSSPDSLRTVAANWRGATLDVNQIICEPRNGIAMIAHDLEKLGVGLVYLGTPAFPGLVYTTHDVVSLNSNFSLYGGFICQGDFHSTGGPTITYDPGYLCRLPDYLNPCPLPTGACCHPDCTCSIQTQAVCEPGGVWYGPGSTCVPSPCDCPPSSAFGGESLNPSSLSLRAAPNPTTGDILIQYGLPVATTVTIEIFNVGGSLVRKIEEGSQPAGSHTVRSDGPEGSTHPLPSGVYLAKLTTSEGSTTTRVVVAK